MVKCTQNQFQVVHMHVLGSLSASCHHERNPDHIGLSHAYTRHSPLTFHWLWNLHSSVHTALLSWNWHAEGVISVFVHHHHWHVQPMVPILELKAIIDFHPLVCGIALLHCWQVFMQWVQHDNSDHASNWRRRQNIWNLRTGLPWRSINWRFHHL